MSVTAEAVRQLRERTGAGMMECKRALVESGGDLDAAAELMRKQGLAKADKKAARIAADGVIVLERSADGHAAAMVEINCETDFVARTDDFKELAREIALHIASAAPVAVDRDGVSSELVERERAIFEEQARASGKPDAIVQKMVEGKVDSYYKEVVLVSQPYVREPKKTIGDLIKEASAKLGEHIQVRRFTRYQLGEE